MGSLWTRVIVVIMISVLVLEEAKRSNGCWDEERTALLHLKSFFNLKMMEEGPDCCEWKWGWVECNVTTRRVTGIYLNVAKNYFSYKLNTSYLFNASIFLPFEDLRTLDLSYIGFAGSVENQGIEKLSKLRHLQNLSLAGNDLFTGSNLTDEIKLLSRMSSLEILDLSRTNMTNNYLSYLGGFSSLRSLTLQGNYLQGTVEIEDFYNLKKLDLSQNGIETLQSSYGSGRLINLQEIDLSYNLFDNNILAELGGCLNLKCLNLRGNRLIGSIDVKEFCGWSNLESLDVSQNWVNQFVSSKEKRCFKKLKFLYLEALSTNGNTTLVSLLEAFPSVKTLFLRDNYFLNNTEVNQQLHVLRNVENLILDFTPLPFNFLQSIGILTSLKTLSLYGCGLTGTLPTQGWCYLKSLEELSLRRNALGGEITSCLGNLTSLRYLDIAGNYFTGIVADTPLTNLSMLQFLSLSFNQFHVPLSFKSFANHSNLKVLLARGNKFVAEPATSQTWSPKSKFQLKVFDMSSCEIDEDGKLQLPNFLYYQYDLRYIDLSYCSYGGIGFPHWLVENNTRLEDLLLIDTSIVGPLFLPSHPNPYLKTFVLSYNHLQHEIPRNFCSIFPNLETLWLSENALKSTIPVCLGGMQQLIYLDMSVNNLSGGIPKELAMSRSLVFLDLSVNTLSGKIFPPIYYFFNSLAVVLLRGNKFEGEIPDFSTISSTNLYMLDVGFNNLSGKLPKWLWKNTNIERLDLSRNHFEGSIPMEFCNLVDLLFLDLSENHLSGTIPSCSNLQKIGYVHLRKNKLSGPLSPAFNGSSLVTLDLSENSLTGEIPDWVGMLPNLSILLLKANQFDGELPVHFCRLYALSILDVSRNKLSGSRFTIYDQISNKGTIPPGMGNLSEIRGLNLSHNNLTGAIPSTFSKLKQIESLDLSYNNLTGRIPSELTEMTALAVFSVAHNNLSGPLPNRKNQFGTFEENSYKGNPLLCGPPLNKSCSEGTPSASSSEEEHGPVDMGYFYISFAVSYGIIFLATVAVLYINPYWRRAWFKFVEDCSTACYFFIVDRLGRLPCFRRNM
ncbi:receptor-like protein 13 isoform X3 [Gossypium raimondii]|uniref:receptor-like protein 13 isoform X3 n=1 Tax=Gossypium raimondii TaxID=29730 RepID=UPI00227B56FF|nr:receptor-like protein 13 isoform X3 [Gossypium raimondii]